MPVIPYRAQDVQEVRELVNAIRVRRGGVLLNLDRMLLHSPAFAAGWNSFLAAVRNALELPPRLRELAICAVAILNEAEYEYVQHAPEFLKVGGTEAQLSLLRQLESSAFKPNLFNAAEQAVIQLSLEMTRSIRVNAATMEKAKAALPDDQQLMELVAVIATYNMVSRYLVALGVEVEEAP